MLLEPDGLTDTDTDMAGFTDYVGGEFDENHVARAGERPTLEQSLGSPGLGDIFQDAVIASDENFRAMSE